MPARLLAFLVAALILAPGAAAAPAPADLRAFLLRANEPEQPTHTFSRTPSFAWDAVKGAGRYEFQLSTSRTFAENAIVWEDTGVGQPLYTVPLTLPWMSGAKYSWYARVRGVVSGEETPWSAPYGFNLRASEAPRSLSEGSNTRPGLIRWTPVAGATAYEVVFLYDVTQGKNKRIRTATTAADLREYYTFHNGRDWANVVTWRVRALRELEGKPLNSLPVASYGPWSAVHRTVEPDMAGGSLTLGGSVSRSGGSDVVSRDANGGPGPGAHELVPGFWWSGMYGPLPGQLGACPELQATLALFRDPCPLFRLYVYSDADCVNRVHVSDLVGSPAYVPRLTKPLQLPANAGALKQAAESEWAGDGAEANVFDAAGEKVEAAGTGAQAGFASPAANGESDRATGLWDNDWPTGRYYWTVVPVAIHDRKGALEYRDVALGEDMCAEGNVLPFGKTSAVATTNAADVPFASGTTATRAVRTAATSKPSFYGTPLVAWKPTPGAKRYQVQWSARAYPWRTAGTVKTASTSTLLPLKPGQWYYRVRGLDDTIPAASKGMTWSDPTYVKILPRTFTVESRTS